MDFLFPFDIHKSQADELFAYIGYRPVKALEKSTYDTKERQKGERKSEWEKESAMEKGGTKGGEMEEGRKSNQRKWHIKSDCF